MANHIPKAFKWLLNQPEPKMGGKKSAAKKAYATNNNAPANFRPGAAQKLNKGGKK